MMRATRVAEDERKRNEELTVLNAALQKEVAERRAAEERAKVNNSRLQAVVDNLPLGAVTISEQSMLIGVNQRCCDILELGVQAHELEGLHADDYFARVLKRVKDPDSYKGIVEMILKATEPLTHYIELKDGRIIERIAVPIDAQGTPGGHLLLYRDVTKDMRSSTSKSEFMSLASHQLRTPLTAIRWSFGRLQKSLGERVTATERKLLEDGLESARRMSGTIDTMLAISRIEAGKIRPAPSELKLGAFLNEIRVAMRELYEEKQQTFTLDCPSNLLLKTDADILEEIVINLYSNAIKYTPERGTITVRVEKQGDWVMIDVQDDGYGIPKNQQERIFTKFFRADNIVGADTAGTGLGLYLVSLLTKILGGQITFVSAQGRGTTFTLRVPGML